MFIYSARFAGDVGKISFRNVLLRRQRLSAVGIINGDFLVGLNVCQQLYFSIGPGYFERIGSRRISQTEISFTFYRREVTPVGKVFVDLALAVMNSMGKKPSITYIDMPQDLHGKYQYFTQANVAKLREAGYTEAFHSLEDGVADYVQNYLMQADPYC